MLLRLTETDGTAPATVVTCPAGFIFLIRLLLASATNRFPETSTVIPAGSLKEVAVPIPFKKPALPLPAIVFTVPSGATLRMRLLRASVTYKLPEASTVRLLGK